MPPSSSSTSIRRQDLSILDRHYIYDGEELNQLLIICIAYIFQCLEKGSGRCKTKILYAIPEIREELIAAQQAFLDKLWAEKEQKDNLRSQIKAKTDEVKKLRELKAKIGSHRPQPEAGGSKKRKSAPADAQPDDKKRPSKRQKRQAGVPESAREDSDSEPFSAMSSLASKYPLRVAS